MIAALAAAGVVSAAVGLSSGRPPQVGPAGGGQRSAEVVDDRPEGHATGYGRRHALVVGLDRYRGAGGPFADLHGAGYDAQEIAEVLASRYGFEDVELLVDSPPRAPHPGVGLTLVPPPEAVTATRLADRLDALRRCVGPGDALVFYYAGHGHRRGAEGYLIPAGGRPDDPATMLDLADVARRLRRCDAHHTLMVLDCCFSGVALEPGSGVERAVRDGGPLDDRLLGVAERDNVERVLNRLRLPGDHGGHGQGAGRRRGAQISQDYAEGERAAPEYRGHSPFTAVLLQALRGLTGLPDGRQLASDLGYYMGSTLVSDGRVEDAPGAEVRVARRRRRRLHLLPRAPGDQPAVPRRDVPGWPPVREPAGIGMPGGGAVPQGGNGQPDWPHPQCGPPPRRLVGDIQPGPRLAAVATLAELAASTPADVPEFASRCPRWQKWPPTITSLPRSVAVPDSARLAGIVCQRRGDARGVPEACGLAPGGMASLQEANGRTAPRAGRSIPATDRLAI